MDNRDFIGEILGRKTWKEHPLQAIGFSRAILDLGLSPDDLYEHCRRIARDLLARVHPDRRNGVASPLVAKFSDALNLLNDRKVFDRALQAFRDKEAALRKENIDLCSEIRTLRIRIRNLEEQIAFLEGRLKALQKGR
jgi:hypothetical protein